MSYTLSWYPGYEGRVLVNTIEGDFTIDELEVVVTEVAALLRQGTPPIHLVHDMTGLKDFPKRPNQMRQLATRIDKASIGWTLLVGASSLVGTFATITAQLAGYQLRSFTTVAEAVAFIAQQDPTLVN